MGVHDLRMHNIALLVKWWWRVYNSPTSLWTMVLMTFKTTGAYANGSRLWMVSGSFVWTKLLSLIPLFHFFIQWIVGDGSTTSYWRDPWAGVLLIRLLEQGDRPTQPMMSMQDAYPIRHTLHTEQVETNSVIFSNDRDTMRWNWGHTGIYSASLLYQAMVGGGRIEDAYKMLWKWPVSPTVQIFGYLLLKRRILTQDLMQRENMGLDIECRMCKNYPFESVLHLIFLCPTFVEVWCEIAVRVGYRFMILREIVEEIWMASLVIVKLRGKRDYRKWKSIFLCACWNLWNRRNEKVFSSRVILSRVLANRIIEEGMLWSKYCNSGARRFMGTNLLLEPN